MITQSFLYNAIFFTSTLVLANFYGVDEKKAPLFLIAFAVGNLVRARSRSATSSTPSAARR